MKENKEQEYILENQDSFELAHIFECGQCFRWNKQEDGSYTGVFKGNVLNVNKIDDKITFKGICNRPNRRNCKRLFRPKKRLW